MNWKTTLVLLVLVAGLGTWVYFAEDQIPVTTPGGSTIIIPKFKVDDVTRVVVKRGKGLAEEVVLVKDGPVWKMEKPSADKADEGKVRELLAPIEFLEPTGKKEGDEAKKVAFGEVQQRLEVSRPADKGGDFAVEVGAKIPPGDTVWFRVVGKDNVVYTIKRDPLSDRMAWEPFELRTKELITFGTNEIGKLTAKTPGGQGPNAPPVLLELALAKDMSWRVGGTDGELAESKKVTELLEKAHGLKAKGVVSEKPSDADLTAWGLAPAPLCELTLVDSAEKATKTETLAIGKPLDATRPDERYARLLGKTTVYKLDAGELLKDLGKNPDTFRSDAIFPLVGGSEAVTAVSAKWKGGREWKLAKKAAENEWNFELPGKAKGDTDAVKAIIRGLADLKISTREAAGANDPKFGLAEPAYTVTLSEGDTARTLEVGASADGGVFFVRRAGESRVYSTKIGDLAGKLENAPLGARAKQMFKASYWEMSAWKLTDKEGKVALSGEKKGNIWNITPGYERPEDVDTTKLSAAFTPLEGLMADALVAEVTSASQAQYGLDKPTTLSVTVDSWEANKNEKKKEERVLLIGNREGADSLYVMEKGGTAIGKVKAEFLDLIQRGFKKGKPIFEYKVPDCFSIQVKDGDQVVLHLEKKKDGAAALDEWYGVAAVASGQKLVEADLRKALNPFEKLEASTTEPASAESKKARGLDPPARTIVFQTKPAWGEHKDEVTTKTLLIGARAGEHDVWAMDAAGTEIGTIYDGPINKIDGVIKNPPIEKKSEEKKGEERKPDGTAPVGTPSSPNK